MSQFRFPQTTLGDVVASSGSSPQESVCSMMIPELLIPLSDVPLGCQVTKRKGTYKYEVVDHIRVFANDVGKQQEIVAQHGVRFLQGRAGNFNAYPGTLLVLWQPDSLAALERWMTEMYALGGTYGPTSK